MAENKKTLLSGIQPSGKLHIGNYFGAMKQFVEYQDTYNTYISIVNYHTLTTLQDKEKLLSYTIDAVIDHLAVGLNPEKAVIFLQSDLPAVTELTWIFDCIMTVPYLERGVAYKEKIDRGIIPSMGLLNYPVLQAADILVMDADVVPVGADQKQHIEYARDIAEKFNNTFGQTLKLPNAIIKEEVSVIPGLDGKKMSKSYGNTIPLFASDEEIRNLVMSIPTDSKSVDEPKDPEKDIVYQLHKLFAGEHLEKITEGYERGGLPYSESKKMLVEEITSFVAPLRERREKIAAKPEYVKDILKEGGKKAQEKAKQKMNEVREMVGFLTL